MADELDPAAGNGELNGTAIDDAGGNDPISQLLASEGGDQGTAAIADAGAAGTQDGGAAGGGDASGGGAAQPIDWREAARQYGYEDFAAIEDPAQMQAEVFGRMGDLYQLALIGQQYQQEMQQRQMAQQMPPQYGQPQGFQNYGQGQLPQYGQPQFYGHPAQYGQQALPNYGQPAVPAIPQWDPTWNQFVFENPHTGRTEFRPLTPPDVRQQITNYAEWQAQFKANPFQALQPVMQPWVQQQVQQQIAQYEQRNQQAATFNELRSFMDSQHTWLFQHDAAGNVIKTPSEPEGRLSPTGYEFFQNITLLNNAGVRDHRLKLQLAARLTMARMQGGQQQPDPNAQQQPDPALRRQPPARQLPNPASRGLHTAFRKAGGRGNGVRNTNKPGAPAAGTKRSWRETVLAQADADGIRDEDVVFDGN